MHEWCPVIVKYCYVDESRVVHHRDVHFNPRSEWFHVRDIAQSLQPGRPVEIFRISRSVWHLIGVKGRKASGHHTLLGDYSSSTPASLKAACDISLKVYIYIDEHLPSRVKAQTWTDQALWMEFYVPHRGTLEVIGRAYAHYDTDVNDLQGQCVQSDHNEVYLYIVPTSDTRGGACILSPRGPNDLVYVRECTLWRLMKGGFFILKCTHIASMGL
jgi:hypothetical protein